MMGFNIYSFIGHNMRFAAKFREWVTNGIKAVAVDDPSVAANSGDSAEIKMDSTGLEALAYLAYETVGSITEMALAARHNADPAKKTDPVQMALYPVAFNTQYPMVQVRKPQQFSGQFGIFRKRKNTLKKRDTSKYLPRSRAIF